MVVDGRGRLHVAVGAPCNVCAVSGFEGTIIRLDTPLNSGRAEIVARGIRNSVGIDFNPLTGDMFFTDNGSDFLGDDLPPDELNHATADGLHFGFPFFGGGSARTREFAEQKILGRLVAPVIEFGAHVAALGIHFYRGDMFPRAYRGDAFVAQHGSWNRRIPDGYRVMRIRFDAAGRPVAKEVFAEGWLVGRRAWGRPVDIKELPDGSLLISDDKAGVIYRITYEGR